MFGNPIGSKAVTQCVLLNDNLLASMKHVLKYQSANVTMVFGRDYAIDYASLYLDIYFCYIHSPSILLYILD